MTLLDNLLKSKEELNNFLKEYDEHIGLRKKLKKSESDETKFVFGHKQAQNGYYK